MSDFFPDVNLPGPCEPLLACGGLCPGEGDNIFKVVYAKPRVSKGTIITWILGANKMAGPLSFQLELNRAGHDRADDWKVVQPFTEDAIYLLDHNPRNAGWFQRAYYRVTVKDAAGRIVQSTPIPANQGKLNQLQAGLYNEIVRREHQRSRVRATPTTQGYLLKVKYYGERCQQCIDPDSGQPYTDDCPKCFGVGYLRGYHRPYPCFNVDLSPVPHDLTMYQDQGPVVTGATSMIRYCAVPVEAHPWDVWVDAMSDYRYLIGQIQPIIAFGSLNVVCNAAVARLPFDHPVYKVPLAGVDVMNAALWP